MRENEYVQLARQLLHEGFGDSVAKVKLVQGPKAETLEMNGGAHHLVCALCWAANKVMGDVFHDKSSDAEEAEDAAHVLAVAFLMPALASAKTHGATLEDMVQLIAILCGDVINDIMDKEGKA